MIRIIKKDGIQYQIFDICNDFYDNRYRIEAISQLNLKNGNSQVAYNFCKCRTLKECFQNIEHFHQGYKNSNADILAKIGDL